MLLSNSSRKIGKGRVSFAYCGSLLRPQKTHKPNRTKFSIANGFAIGKFHKEIQCHNSKDIRKVDVEKCLTKEDYWLQIIGRMHMFFFSVLGGDTCIP